MSLYQLLNPRHIAVVGGRSAEEVIRQCDKLGFAGSVYAVNPRRDTLVGRDCYARLSDLPEMPDAVFIGAPAEATIALVEDVVRLGCHGAVCLASGFSEIGQPGVERQAALVAAAAGTPLIGPNCYGVINYMNGAALWPDQHGGERVEHGVAIITQSGNMAVNFTMQQRGIPLAMLICLGNQANVGIQDCVAAMLEDPRITAIGLHIEGLNDIAAFTAVAAQALRLKKPIVALKTGRSAVGASIAQSHTASLVGADNLFDALFQRLGIARVDSVDEFLETLKFLSFAGPINSNHIASMSCSGGEASLIADLAENSRLVFPAIGEAQRQQLLAALGERVSLSNPLDYHTYVWADQAAMCKAFTAMLLGDYAVAFLVYDFPRADRCRQEDWWAGVRAFAQAAKTGDSVAAILATMSETIDEATAKQLMAEGIVPMLGMQQAIVALESALQIGRAQRQPPCTPQIDPTYRAGGAHNLTEWQATQLLQQAGLGVPQNALISTVDQAVTAATHIGYPVVMKIVSNDVVHKTDAGGVVLDLDSAQAVRDAATHLLTLSSQLMVARMVQAAVAEMIVGVSRDPLFGPYMMIGLGGISVELIADRRILLLPTSEQAVREALLGLRLAPLLQGYRGRPVADIDALVEAVLAIARFVDQHSEAIMDMEVNPLLVCRQGEGAWVADAFMNIIGEI